MRTMILLIYLLSLPVFGTAKVYKDVNRDDLIRKMYGTTFRTSSGNGKVMSAEANFWGMIGRSVFKDEDFDSFIYYRRIASPREKVYRGEGICLIYVPCMSQFCKESLSNMNCGPASAEMAAAYVLRRGCDYENVKALNRAMGHNELKGDAGGTGYSELAKACSKVYGLEIVSKQLTLDEVLKLVDDGKPVVVGVLYSKLSNREDKNYKGGHFVTVCGYSDVDVIVNDPDRKDYLAPGKTVRYSRTEFTAAMAGLGNGCLVGFSPKEPEYVEIHDPSDCQHFDMIATIYPMDTQLLVESSGTLFWSKDFLLGRRDLIGSNKAVLVIKTELPKGVKMRIHINRRLVGKVESNGTGMEHHFPVNLNYLYIGRNLLDCESDITTSKEQYIGISYPSLTVYH